MTAKQILFVSFSGGRTSAYMCHWLLENKSDEYDLKFVFANTGLEHEKTLEFVDRCDKEMGLSLVWIESLVNPEHNKGTTHNIVNYNTAARNGQPFESVISKYGIPNKSYPHCNRELKLKPIFSYKRSIGFKSNHLMAVGIRIDEIDRMSPTAKKDGLIYPLISMTQTTKAEVRHWWDQQNFDLEIPEHLGNCVTCWKKSHRKLMTIAKHNPDYFDFFDRMEREHKNAGAGDGGRTFFRNHRTTQDIIASSKKPFVEFVDHMPELQLGLDFDPLDIESDCGAGCEI